MLLIPSVLALSGFIERKSVAISSPMVFPAGNGVVAPNPDFNALYDLSLVPNIPIQAAHAVVGPVPCVPGTACSFGCGCTRPEDIVTCPNNQEWGLTYDDGPSEFTPLVLDYLQRSRVRATFFVIGSQVRLHPDILRRAHSEGHQIAIHTWSHRSLVTLPNEVVLAELEWTARIIESTIGVRPKYFRPPFGDLDDRVRAIARIMGLIPVVWNFDSRDFTGANDIELRTYQTAQNWRQATSGIISLQHDLYAHQVVHVLPVINRILQAGMQIGSVADCLNDRNLYINGPLAPTRLPPAPVPTQTSPLVVITTIPAPTINVDGIPPSTPTPSSQSKSSDAARMLGWLHLLSLLLL
jgi:peptidoglycan/xylan/chitin deacetylase (PgdA/CDA1 family)